MIWRFLYRFVGILWLILGTLIMAVAFGYLVAVDATNKYLNSLLSSNEKDLIVPLLVNVKPGVQQVSGVVFAAYCIAFGVGLIMLRGWARTIGITFHFIAGLVAAVMSILLYYRMTMTEPPTVSVQNSQSIILIASGFIIAAGLLGLGFQLSTHSAMEAFSGYIPTPPAMPPVNCPTCGGPLDLEKSYCPNCDAEIPSAAISHARLVELKSKREYPVSTRRPVRIGRDIPGLEISLEDTSVSGEHAFIEYVDGHFYLHALKDTNGTFLNGMEKPINDAEIRTDDLITFGRARFRFEVE